MPRMKSVAAIASANWTHARVRPDLYKVVRAQAVQEDCTPALLLEKAVLEYLTARGVVEVEDGEWVLKHSSRK